MTYFKWAVKIIVVLSVLGLLYYIMPQRDVVRIIGTYEERIEIEGWTRYFWADPQPASTGAYNRDVQFIQAVDYDSGKAIVYRNEDTGWGWPFYFKFNTSTLYAEASDLVSTKEDPEWVILKHYGIRSELLSVFPNATAVKTVNDPNRFIVPWSNLIVFALFFVVFMVLRRKWNRFFEDKIEPVMIDAEMRYEDATESFKTKWKKK